MNSRPILLALGVAGALGIVAAMVAPTRASAPVADRNAESTNPSRAAVATARPLIIENLVTAPWGAGTGQLGHHQPAEGNPEGPMSLRIDTDGQIFVLDQVNARIAIFNPYGKPAGAIALPSATVQDFALNPAGGYVLLDRLVARSLLFVDQQGTERSRVPLEADGLADAGGVTAMHVQADGVWVEYEHRKMSRVAGLDGKLEETRPVLEGRPFGSNMLVRAARDPKGIAVVSAFSSSMDLGSGYLAKVKMAGPIAELLEVTGDAQGRVTVAAVLQVEAPVAPHAIEQRSIELAVLSPNGLVERRGEIPAPEVVDEQFRPIATGPDGAIYHLHLGALGATVRRAR